MDTAETETNYTGATEGDADDAAYSIPDDLLGKPALLLIESEAEYLKLRRAFFHRHEAPWHV